jgi:hypothetical protein
VTIQSENRLSLLTDRFATSIATLGQSNLLFSLRKFPLGACGGATLLFARYLYQNGFPLSQYVAGERDDGRTHAWIESDGLIIDISAGQFSDAPAQVIITRDSSWHAQFKEQKRHPADISLYDENSRMDLLEAYEQIVSNVA